MTELRFEWDEAKSTANQDKHGVTFDEAKTVFASGYFGQKSGPSGTQGI